MKGWYGTADKYSQGIHYHRSLFSPWGPSGPAQCILGEQHGGVTYNALLWMFTTKRFSDWSRINTRLMIV